MPAPISDSSRFRVAAMSTEPSAAICVVAAGKTPRQSLRIGCSLTCLGAQAGSLGVPARQRLQIGDNVGAGNDIDVAAADIAQVFAVRPLLDIAHAVFRNDGAISMLEAVNRRGADASARVASGEN